MTNCRVGTKTTMQLEVMLREYIETHTVNYKGGDQKMYIGDVSYLIAYQNLRAYNAQASHSVNYANVKEKEQ